MNITERDALLGRIDERTKNLLKVVDEQDNSINKKIDKIIGHQEKQNDKINKNRIMIIALIALLIGMGVLEWQNVIHIFG